MATDLYGPYSELALDDPKRFHPDTGFCIDTQISEPMFDPQWFTTGELTSSMVNHRLRANLGGVVVSERHRALIAAHPDIGGPVDPATLCAPDCRGCAEDRDDRGELRGVTAEGWYVDDVPLPDLHCDADEEIRKGRVVKKRGRSCRAHKQTDCTAPGCR